MVKAERSLIVKEGQTEIFIAVSMKFWKKEFEDTKVADRNRKVGRQTRPWPTRKET